MSGIAPPPLAKVCGLTRRGDALAADAAGADYLGVVLAAGGRRSLAVDVAAAVLSDVRARRVGVFVNQPLPEIAAAAAAIGLDVVQLHGDEPPDEVAAVRDALGLETWKAVRPRDAAELREAVARYGDAADALLLDGWSATAYGGTGARLPWALLAEARAALPDALRLVVAGGLTPANVSEAVRLLRPYAVDVSSGVESEPGLKDHGRIAEFLSAARAGPAESRGSTA